MKQDAKVERDSVESPSRTLSDAAHAAHAVDLIFLTLIASALAWDAYEGGLSHHWQYLSILLSICALRAALWAQYPWIFNPGFRSSDLDAVILRTRTGLPEIGRIDLREDLPIQLRRVGSGTAIRVLAGVTATLSSLAREPTHVNWRVLPFPVNCGREDLIEAIIFSGGVSRRRAEQLFDALSDDIRARIALASQSEKGAIEIFPLGLFEDITIDGATFSSQSLVLRRGYPELSAALASYEAEGRAS